jgi:adenylate kinase
MGSTMKLPVGQKLLIAAQEQEKLLQVLRDEREERALASAENLTRFTQQLVTATWAIAIMSGALILTGVVQIAVMLVK